MCGCSLRRGASTCPRVWLSTCPGRDCDRETEILHGAPGPRATCPDHWTTWLPVSESEHHCPSVWPQSSCRIHYSRAEWYLPPVLWSQHNMCGHRFAGDRHRPDRESCHWVHTRGSWRSDISHSWLSSWQSYSGQDDQHASICWQGNHPSLLSSFQTQLAFSC